MRTQDAIPSEGMSLSGIQLIVLIATLGFGALLGGFLARFLAPSSGLAMLVGVGVFPTVLLGGGLLVEELWFLRIWQRQPSRWNLEINDSAATPATHAERQRSAIFLPVGLIVGALGGLVVGMMTAQVPIVPILLLFGLAGLGYGGVVYSLVQFSLLPSLGHGRSAERPREPATEAKAQPHTKQHRFDAGRPEF